MDEMDRDLKLLIAGGAAFVLMIVIAMTWAC